MTSVGDKDGLMGTIMAMITPPTSSNGSKKGTKGTPKELLCDSCGDTGDKMLSCSECQGAIYHPICDDPPLDEFSLKKEDIKNWKCKKCRKVGKNNKNGRGFGFFGLGKLTEEELNVKYEGGVPNPLGISDSEDDDKQNKQQVKMEVEMEEDVGDDKEPQLSPLKPIKESPNADLRIMPILEPQIPLELLGLDKDKRAPTNKKKGWKGAWNKRKKKKITPRGRGRGAAHVKIAVSQAVHASIPVNPLAFELPPNYETTPYYFPGTSRSVLKGASGAKLKPAIIDLDSNFCVPRPMCKCYICGISVRKAPLVMCDFCFLHFHFDCLTPPLTAPPCGLWMCHLHVEPFLEKRLMTSALSGRVSLWDFTHKPVDAGAVCLNFLARCASSGIKPKEIQFPQLRPTKTQWGQRGRSVLDNPDTGVRIRFLDRKGLDEQKKSSKRHEELYSSYHLLFEAFDAKNFDHSAYDADMDSVLGWLGRKGLHKAAFEIFDLAPEQIPDEPERKKARGENGTNEQDKLKKTAVPPNKTFDTKRAPDTDAMEIDLENVSEVKSERRQLPRRKCAQKTQPAEAAGSARAVATDAIIKEDVELTETSKMAPPLAVATRKRSRATGPVTPRRIFTKAPVAAPEFNGVDLLLSAASMTKAKYRETPFEQTRKILAPSKIELIFVDQMLKWNVDKQQIHIGTVPPNGSSPYIQWINPLLFVPHCKRISGVHAKIYYDRVRKQWEVLNYSEHGLSVDSQRLELNPNAKPRRSHSKPSSLQTIKQEVMEDQRKVVIDKLVNQLGVQPKGAIPVCECDAEQRTRTIRTWRHEGALPINYRSCVMIGCLRFYVWDILHGSGNTYYSTREQDPFAEIEEQENHVQNFDEFEEILLGADDTDPDAMTANNYPSVFNIDEEDED